MKTPRSYYFGLIIAMLCSLVYGFTTRPHEFMKQDDKAVSLAEFNKAITKRDKMVLVYFSAKWCMICPKLKPIIDDIEKDKADKLEVLRIDTDRDKEVTQEFEIDALPVLFLYKNGKREWIQMGLIEKNKLYEKIDSYN